MHRSGNGHVSWWSDLCVPVIPGALFFKGFVAPESISPCNLKKAFQCAPMERIKSRDLCILHRVIGLLGLHPGATPAWIQFPRE